MNSPATAVELQAAWTEGTQALRGGRPDAAVAAFGRITAAGQANASVWIALALAHKARDDRAAERAALDEARTLEPRNLRALVMTADHFADAGDSRAASAFYDAVVKVAVSDGAVEPAMEAEVGRAQHMRERYAADYEAYLRRGLGAGGGSSRFERSLDLLLGKAELYVQQPKNYYFPELPNIQYAERAAFPWLDRLEAATDAIRADLLRVLDEDSAFAPYVEAESNRPFFDTHGMLGNPDWSAFYLWKGGAPVEENLARCPSVMEALADAPLCQVPGRTPSILFSLLRPGAHIQPHHGFTNARYICHLPVIVPDGCAMRVGSDTRPWVEGQACVFDDSIEHEAWNHSPDRLRVVLIFDIWRPELTAAEREMVSGLLQAVDAYAPNAASAEPSTRKP